MNLKKRAVGGIPTQAEQADDLIEQYRALDEAADRLISNWVDEYSRRCPGVPRPALRMLELDARSHGYVHREALQRLRDKL